MTVSGKAAKEPTALPVWPGADTLPCLWAAILLVNEYKSPGGRARWKCFYKTSGLLHLSQASSAFSEPAETGQVSPVYLTPLPFRDCAAAARSNADLDPASDLVDQVRPGAQRSISRCFPGSAAPTTPTHSGNGPSEMRYGSGAARDKLQPRVVGRSRKLGSAWSPS